MLFETSQVGYRFFFCIFNEQYQYLVVISETLNDPQTDQIIRNLEFNKKNAAFVGFTM